MENINRLCREDKPVSYPDFAFEKVCFLTRQWSVVESAVSEYPLAQQAWYQVGVWEVWDRGYRLAMALWTSEDSPVAEHLGPNWPYGSKEAALVPPEEWVVDRLVFLSVTRMRTSGVCKREWEGDVCTGGFV